MAPVRALVAARTLRENGWLKPEDTVVLFLTANGFKYPLKGVKG